MMYVLWYLLIVTCHVCHVCHGSPPSMSAQDVCYLIMRMQTVLEIIFIAQLALVQFPGVIDIYVIYYCGR